ncbi:MAG: hydantoinase B/oxoprolinase family protein [Candidatus Njordarchaeales archaeon]
MIVDKVTIEVIRHYLEYTAEEMGIVLRNSAYSPNIKERMDHSCAIFDAKGQMIAQAEHIPVHLGAMPLAVKSMLETFSDNLYPGDMIIFNDPYRGGTHLPDVTLIAPIFYENEIVGFVANRAHYSDIGGKTPGSMPGDAREIFEEGLIIPPVKLVSKGEIVKDVLRIILANTRTPRIRKGDIYAQIAANIRGIRRIHKLLEKYGVNEFHTAVEEILNYSERRMRKEISKLPSGEFTGEDFLDDDGVEDRPIRIFVTVKIRGDEIEFDFTGTDHQVKGSINAPLAVTLSCSYYVLRAVTDPTIPANEGAYRPLKVIAPEGTVVNAKPPAAVAGGNVETSQRIVDALLKAFAKIVPERIPAASQGTMNNIAIGGIDPRTGKPFTFYETIGGGFGGRRGLDGVDGVHSHMTNTMNTPIEEIERRYPIMILKYSLRPNSGGLGQWRGGLGIERIYKILAPATLSLLGDRHKFPPWGLNNGEPGAPGEYILIRKGRKIKLRSKQIINVDAGDIIIIRTPGGGGYGDPSKRSKEMITDDIMDGKITIYPKSSSLPFNLFFL